MSDRRRINGPSGGTASPLYSSLLSSGTRIVPEGPRRTRNDNELRKIFLKTGLIPQGSGSAFLELHPSSTQDPVRHLVPSVSAPKITCVVHGPKPLPRSAPFTPHLLLSTHVKFAPFAARQRRGYIRDATERDLSTHLETALKGAILGDRWPKSGVDVIITILEAEEDSWYEDEGDEPQTHLATGAGWGLMSLLAACITVASAAIADAGIDCVDLISGGVAALLKPKPSKMTARNNDADCLAPRLLLDPSPSEHTDIQAFCVVGYMASRDEITELWVKGSIPSGFNATNDSSVHTNSAVEDLIDSAVQAAVATRTVLSEAVREAAALRGNGGLPIKVDEETEKDVDMAG